MLLKDNEMETVKAFVLYFYAYPRAIEALATFLTDKRSFFLKYGIPTPCPSNSKHFRASLTLTAALPFNSFLLNLLLKKLISLSHKQQFSILSNTFLHTHLT